MIQVNQAASGERGTEASSVRNGYGLLQFQARQAQFASYLRRLPLLLRLEVLFRHGSSN
jgi:hypothetical protein